jgi:flagellar biosynthesis/type III secretory pathway M-ring protein FliF/YscJ
MIAAITILAVAVLLWLILKPFILLYIEKENEKHDKSNR